MAPSQDIVARPMSTTEVQSVHGPSILPQQDTRKSSPLADPNDEDEAIRLFFEWKISKTTSEDVKDRVRKVYEVVERQMWTLEDLKAMEDPSDSLYKIATNLGIPDGMARRFKRELRAYKPVYRTGATLISLGR
jgi:hypothetical protein